MPTATTRDYTQSQLINIALQDSLVKMLFEPEEYFAAQGDRRLKLAGPEAVEALTNSLIELKENNPNFVNRLVFEINAQAENHPDDISAYIAALYDSEQSPYLADLNASIQEKFAQRIDQLRDLREQLNDVNVYDLDEPALASLSAIYTTLGLTFPQASIDYATFALLTEYIDNYIEDLERINANSNSGILALLNMDEFRPSGERMHYEEMSAIRTNGGEVYYGEFHNDQNNTMDEGYYIQRAMDGALIKVDLVLNEEGEPIFRDTQIGTQYTTLPGSVIQLAVGADNESAILVSEGTGVFPSQLPFTEGGPIEENGNYIPVYGFSTAEAEGSNILLPFYNQLSYVDLYYDASGRPSPTQNVYMDFQIGWNDTGTIISTLEDKIEARIDDEAYLEIAAKPLIDMLRNAMNQAFDQGDTVITLQELVDFVNSTDLPLISKGLVEEAIFEVLGGDKVYLQPDRGVEAFDMSPGGAFEQVVMLDGVNQFEGTAPLSTPAVETDGQTANRSGGMTPA